MFKILNIIILFLKETNPVEFHGSAKAPSKKDYYITDHNAVKEMVMLFKSINENEK